MSTAAPSQSPHQLEARALPAVREASDDPFREIRFGLTIAFLFFVLFLGWSAFARLDAAAMARGHLEVSGQRQTIQHKEGGVVSAILVKEGAHVEKGQVLIRLAGADARAQERALSAQAIGLLAQRARLHAEQSGQSTITPPAEFAQLAPEDKAAAAEALRIQTTQMRTRAAVLAAERGSLAERVGQAGDQGQGYRHQLASINEQLKILDEELKGMQQAASKGFVSMNRIRDLERAKSELEGQRGQYSATIAQSHGLASESRLQSLEAQSNYMDKVASELRDVQASLNDVMPKLSAARDQLERTAISAPVSGTIVGLSVFTRGGVIEPGERLMDIVPDRAPLTVQAQISVGDGDDVRVGQKAYVRFDTLHERALPALRGTVTRMSADTLTDEKTGVSYYTAEIDVSPSELEKIKKVRSGDPLRAGLPVSIVIPTRKRTALQYAFEPLTESLRRSFHEH